jgi:hypothetical protein
MSVMSYTYPVFFIFPLLFQDIYRTTMSFICHFIYMSNQSDIYHVFFIYDTIHVCRVIYISLFSFYFQDIYRTDTSYVCNTIYMANHSDIYRVFFIYLRFLSVTSLAGRIHIIFARLVSGFLIFWRDVKLVVLPCTRFSFFYSRKWVVMCASYALSTVLFVLFPCHCVLVSWCHGVLVSWCHGVFVSLCLCLVLLLSCLVLFLLLF